MQAETAISPILDAFVDGRSGHPLRAGQALTMRSLCPVRPRVRADDPTVGADQSLIQIEEQNIVRQIAGPMSADVPERRWRPEIALGSSPRRRIDVGGAVA
jgi:hypothetical protein